MQVDRIYGRNVGLFFLYVHHTQLTQHRSAFTEQTESGS